MQARLSAQSELMTHSGLSEHEVHPMAAGGVAGFSASTGATTTGTSVQKS